tara:strand:- start:3 stop:737 length:735 start_codon:yes stop_codon:yes gene_type:complete
MNNQKIIIEKWRKYEETCEVEHLVEQIWRGDFVTEPLLLENEINLLEEGVAAFFQDAYSSVKSKVDQFQQWGQSKLETFVKAALEKLNDFLSTAREFARTHNIKSLRKLLPKYATRSKQYVLKTLMMPKYLKIGAGILAVILQKAAKLGINTLLDVISGGSASGAKIINFIKENIKKVVLFMQGLVAALDPAGVLEMLESLQMFKDAKELVSDFKQDFADVSGVTAFARFQTDLNRPDSNNQES